MPLHLGSTPITDLRLGSTPITELRLGSTLVWSKSGVKDPTAGGDGPLDWLTDWVNLIPGASIVIGIVGNIVRALLPDNIEQAIAKVTSRFVNTVVLPIAGWVETQIANLGQGVNFITQLFRGNVGLDFRNSQLSLVKRDANTNSDLVVKSFGSFTNNDVVRLVQNGNAHTVFKNGQYVGQWVDQAQGVVVDRNVGLVMQGAAPLTAPLQSSPSLAYITAA